jgi:hypothetical protein
VAARAAYWLVWLYLFASHRSEMPLCDRRWHFRVTLDAQEPLSLVKAACIQENSSVAIRMELATWRWPMGERQPHQLATAVCPR